MNRSIEPLPTDCDGDDWCPIKATSALLGKKWHPVIIHRLLNHGPMGFTELKRHADGVSDKVLSESLKDLKEKGLVEREVIETQPVRVRYSLTGRGEGPPSPCRGGTPRCIP